MNEVSADLTTKMILSFKQTGHFHTNNITLKVNKSNVEAHKEYWSIYWEEPYNEMLYIQGMSIITYKVWINIDIFVASVEIEYKIQLPSNKFFTLYYHYL